jgi:hypothetical protein
MFGNKKEEKPQVKTVQVYERNSFTTLPASSPYLPALRSLEAEGKKLSDRLHSDGVDHDLLLTFVMYGGQEWECTDAENLSYYARSNSRRKAAFLLPAAEPK